MKYNEKFVYLQDKDPIKTLLKKSLLIKISNNKTNFEYPIVLNPEKKYKLGVSHLFSFDKKCEMNFFFDWYIPVPVTTGIFTGKASIVRYYTIGSLKKKFGDGFNGLIEQNKKDKKILY